jgi:hypothetical protein
MVRTIKSNWCDRLRTRHKSTISKRTVYHLNSDKDSKLSTLRTYMKNGNHQQRDAAIAECQL